MRLTLLNLPMMTEAIVTCQDQFKWNPVWAADETHAKPQGDPAALWESVMISTYPRILLCQSLAWEQRLRFEKHKGLGEQI